MRSQAPEHCNCEALRRQLFKPTRNSKGSAEIGIPFRQYYREAIDAQITVDDHES